MSIVKTPLGEIDLDVKPISFYIQDSSIGAKRRVQFDGIRSMSDLNQFAQIVWIVWQEDENGNLKNELDAVQGRQVITPVSGENRVTAEGILIIREAFPEGEVGERAFEMAKSKGYNEYLYWMALLRIAPLPMVLEAAGNLLASYQRFDRA